jgi:hypothetical protein
VGIRATWRDWRAERQRAKVGRGPTENTARKWAFCGVVPIVGLFVTVGVWRNWTTAYLVLTGSETPGAAHASVVAVLLSVGGYLIVPFVVGTAAAGFFQRSVEKKTRLDLAAVAAGGVPAGSRQTGGGSTAAQEQQSNETGAPSGAGKGTGPESRATTGGGTR